MIVILDIFVPAIQGGDPAFDNGVQFVHELRLSNTLIKPGHVIGLTAYDDAIQRAGAAFMEELWLVIKYDATSADWMVQLKTKIRYLVQCKYDFRNGQTGNFDFDLGIVTALWKPEFMAVLDLPLNWDRRTFANDSTDYWVGKPNDKTLTLRVVAASSSQMGIASAAVLGMKIISHFRPRFLAVCGIAAGVRDANVHLGDILIAEQSWDYESGKRRAGQAEGALMAPDPHYIPIGSDLRDRFAECVGRRAYVTEIESCWTNRVPHSPLSAALGPVGSGAAVVA